MKPGSGVFSKDISKIHRRTELLGSRPAPFLPLLKQDFGSGWILEGPAYVGPGTLVVVPGRYTGCGAWLIHIELISETQFI